MTAVLQPHTHNVETPGMFTHTGGPNVTHLAVVVGFEIVRCTSLTGGNVKFSLRRQ